jgi:23S rRNA-/tRNA-specific pseudouridylate synthase
LNVEAIEKGIILINNKRTTPETLLRNGDVISRKVHWHEPPIYCRDDELFVERRELPKELFTTDSASIRSIYCFDKPASMVVHPAGQYLSNSLTMIAECQLSLKPRSLKNCHRVDRATSGLLLCCDDAIGANAVSAAIGDGLVRKLYLARVKGNFAAALIAARLAQAPGVTVVDSKDGDYLEVDQPLASVDAMECSSVIDRENGKESVSRFRLLQYHTDSDESLLLCSPVTGRQHQLRVHLQHVGFPILGDSLYGGEVASPQLLGFDANLEAVEREMLRASAAQATAPRQDGDDAVVEMCDVCRDGVKKSFNEHQLLQHGGMICLHSLKYEVSLKKKGVAKTGNDEDSESKYVKMLFVTRLPHWASDLDVDKLDFLC